MGTVNHDAIRLALLLQGMLGLLDTLRVIVGALATSAQYHKSIVVALGLYDGRKTLRGNAQEFMRLASGEHCISRCDDIAVGCILEPHRK